MPEHGPLEIGTEYWLECDCERCERSRKAFKHFIREVIAKDLRTVSEIRDLVAETARDEMNDG